MSGIMMAVSGGGGGSGSAPPPTVPLTDQFIPCVSSAFGTFVSTVGLTNAGVANGTTTVDGTYVLGNWTSSDPTLLEIYCTVTSGSVTSGTTGSWVAMAASQTWTKSHTYAGPAWQERSVSLNFQVRPAGGSDILGSFNVELYVSIGLAP